MNQALSFARAHEHQIVEMIRRLVECESPSGDAVAVNRFIDLLASEVARIATVRTFDGGKFGRHMRCEFNTPGRRKAGQILVLAHSDTVWPLGTLRTMPFREADGRLWGPGVLDMKSGIALLVWAVKSLVELGVETKRKVVLLVNADEEVGSDTSRPLTEKEATRSVAVLVVEPGTGLTGKVKTARKGVGDYTVVVRGRASHAGVDFAAGASAILELARQIERISGFTNLKRGVTVNPGVIAGGTRTNVVAAEARAEVDIRVPRLSDAVRLERRFHALRPVDKRCTVAVEGGLNRPPMERGPGVVRLLRIAQAVGREIGIAVEESSTGGGSDGNFTAALDVPTLDGLGGVGEGAHAINESILVDRIADRVALLAGLLTRI